MGRLTKIDLAELQKHERTVVINGMPQVTHKKCIGLCEKVKPVEEFRKVKHRGHLTTCRPCEQAKDRHRHLLRKVAR